MSNLAIRTRYSHNEKGARITAYTRKDGRRRQVTIPYSYQDGYDGSTETAARLLATLLDEKVCCRGSYDARSRCYVWFTGGACKK